MKKFVLFLILHCVIVPTYANVTKLNSVEQGKPQDFLLNVFANPSFRIYDFLCVNINETTTEFLSEDFYFNHPRVEKIVRERYGRFDYQLFHNIYLGLSYSWRILLEVQYSNLDTMLKYMTEYAPNNFEARIMQQNCPYPELRDKLKVLPLQIIESTSNHSQNTKVIFKPTSATINDKKGSYTSSNFNSPSITMIDNKSSITVYWGGDKVILNKSPYNEDTYSISHNQNGTIVSFMAYRSSSTDNIYLIFVEMKKGYESTKITFKPQ